MNMCVRRIRILSRWELQRCREAGGVRDIVTCFFGAAPVGFGSAMLGDADLLLVIVALTPAMSAVAALQSFIKEREGGLLPALLSSPATAGDLVLGKTVGYFLFGLSLYWTAIVGALVGLKVGIMARAASLDDGVGINFLLTLAIAMTSVVLAIVATTVSICWHARTFRGAMFWSVAGSGLASGMAIALIAMARLNGTAGALVSACALGVLTVVLALYHAKRLTPERALYKWNKRRSRKGLHEDRIRAPG